MTPIGAIIAALVAAAAWYAGWKMQASILNEVIGYREKEIKNLKQQLEQMDKQSDTLFNEEDMSRAYYHGQANGIKVVRFNEELQGFPEWLAETYKPVETSEISSS